MVPSEGCEDNIFYVFLLIIIFLGDTVQHREWGSIRAHCYPEGIVFQVGIWGKSDILLFYYYILSYHILSYFIVMCASIFRQKLNVKV